MLIALFRWWYSSGWMRAVLAIRDWTLSVERLFSVGILLNTLFAPWRQIITLPGRSINAKLHAMLDNVVSRTIGFIVRIGTLLIALLLMLGAAIAGAMAAVVWPFIPVAAVYCLVRGITG